MMKSIMIQDSFFCLAQQCIAMHWLHSTSKLDICASPFICTACNVQVIQSVARCLPGHCKHFCSTSFLAAAQVSGQDRPNLQDKRSQLHNSKLIISAPENADNARTGEGGATHYWDPEIPKLGEIENLRSEWCWLPVGCGDPPLSVLIGLHSVALREAHQQIYYRGGIASHRAAR